MALDDLAIRIDGSPFNHWMGMRPLLIDEQGVTIQIVTRPEMIGSQVSGALHGGVAAALLDSACSYAWLVRTGGRVWTIDLRTDFHRPMTPGTFTLRGDVIRAGRTIVTADARITDGRNRLIASGRAVMSPIGAD